MADLSPCGIYYRTNLPLVDHVPAGRLICAVIGDFMVDRVEQGEREMEDEGGPPPPEPMPSPPQEPSEPQQPTDDQAAA